MLLDSKVPVSEKSSVVSITFNENNISDPVIILDDKHFTQNGVKNRVTHVEIYSSNNIAVITENNQRIWIEKEFSDLSSYAHIQKLTNYLKQVFFEITQFEDGGYKIKTKVRGLGGGNNPSKAASSNQSSNTTLQSSSIQSKPVKKGNLPPPGKQYEKLSSLVKAGNIVELQKYLEKGYDPNSLSAEWRKPEAFSILGFARQSKSENRIAMIKLLLEYKADPDQPEYWGYEGSFFQHAVYEKEVALMCIEAGANLNIPDSIYGTFFHQVIKKDNLDWLAIAMINAGVKMDETDAEGCTALSYAVSDGKKDLVEALLRKGANPSCKEYGFGTTRCSNVLGCAIRNDYNEIAIMLINAGAELNPVLRYEHEKPLRHLFSNKNVTILQVILQKGINPTPLLHQAIYDQNKEFVAILLAARANPNDYGAYPGIAGVYSASLCDMTSLTIACFVNNKDIIDLLLPLTKNVDAAKNNSCTALYYACRHDNREVIIKLISLGADPNKILRNLYWGVLSTEIRDFMWENVSIDRSILDDVAAQLASKTIRHLSPSIKLSRTYLDKFKEIVRQILSKTLFVKELINDEDDFAIKMRSKLADKIAKEIEKIIKNPYFVDIDENHFDESEIKLALKDAIKTIIVGIKRSEEDKAKADAAKKAEAEAKEEQREEQLHIQQKLVDATTKQTDELKKMRLEQEKWNSQPNRQEAYSSSAAAAAATYSPTSSAAYFRPARVEQTQNSSNSLDNAVKVTEAANNITSAVSNIAGLF